MNLPATLTRTRRELLREIPADNPLLAPAPATAFVWPTEDCSVGCAHCNFSSTPLRAAPRSLSAQASASIVGWLNDAGARKIVLCGGGEPLDEPEICDEIISRASATRLGVGVYTSGASLRQPASAERQVRRWKRLRQDDHGGDFGVRLSFDAFHADRVGVAPVVDWVRAVRAIAPEWKLSLRGIRLIGDDSLDAIARALGAQVAGSPLRQCRLVLPDGHKIPVEHMAYVPDGRASIGLLRRRGLRLPPSDEQGVRHWSELTGRGDRLGRPISRRLTVGARHLDLEIHSDAVVHVLESQPQDMRISFTRMTWAQMRDAYFRDPLIHAVAHGGLAVIAELLERAVESGVAPRGTVSYSLEHLTDRGLLDWLTCTVIVRYGSLFGYPDGVLRRAADCLGNG